MFTAPVFRTIFLPVGLFHFKHNVLLSHRFSTWYSIQPNGKSRNRQRQILSGGKTAGQDTSPVASQRTQRVHVYQPHNFLSTFSDIAGSGMCSTLKPRQH